MNLNELAVKITEKEGGVKQVNIAQVKDVLDALGQVLNTIKWKECLKLVGDIRKAGKN